MPIVEVQTNVVLDESAVERISVSITQAIANLLPRTQATCTSYTCPRVLVALSYAQIYVDASAGPAAQVVVRSATELSHRNKRELCLRLVNVLADYCAIDERRVFVQITQIPPEEAWNVEAGNACSVQDRMGGMPQDRPIAHEIPGG